MREFKVGDIVYHRSGRICNGLFGVIVLAPEGDGSLCVCDNEGAPDMDVEQNKADLEIVGDVEHNRALLDLFWNADKTLLLKALNDAHNRIVGIYAMQGFDTSHLQESFKLSNIIIHTLLEKGT
jgi:hypothetical protein